MKHPADLFEPFGINVRNAILVVYYGVMRKRVEWNRMATGRCPWCRQDAGSRNQGGLRAAFFVCGRVGVLPRPYLWPAGSDGRLFKGAPMGC